MPDLDYSVESVEPERFAAEPILRFGLKITQRLKAGDEPTPIHAVALRCQVRIEPARRRYTADEQARLLDLFGTPERWGQTLRPMLWTHVGTVVRPFVGETAVSLPVPCSSDFNLAASKYFDAIDDGEVPLCFLFSGTIFHEGGDDGSLRVAQISWEKEANFRLPAGAWRQLMEYYHPNSAWLNLRKDVFDRLARYRSLQGVATWEQAVDRLLASASEPITP